MAWAGKRGLVHLWVMVAFHFVFDFAIYRSLLCQGHQIETPNFEVQTRSTYVTCQLEIIYPSASPSGVRSGSIVLQFLPFYPFKLL
jgi:hypothetical protein